MRKLVITTLVFLLTGLSASYARGGHGGGMHGGAMGGGAMHGTMNGGAMNGGGMNGGGMHGGAMQGLMAPANPTVPPALTSDPRLIGTAPLPPQHQPTSADVPSSPNAMYQPTPGEIAVDRAIGSICRGC